VELIAFTHEAVAPFGKGNGEQAINHHRTEYRQRIHRTEVGQQNDSDQANFQQGRQDIEHHEAQQKADATGTALDIPRQSTGPARQMKAKIQPVQVLEYLERYPPHCPLGRSEEHTSELQSLHDALPILKLASRMTVIRPISSKVGRILNTMKRNRKLMPLVPRSISRASPPVRRDKSEEHT